MTAIILSIIALTVSLILAIRLFLLDKDYCEFSITYYGGGNNGLTGDVLERKHGYTLTLLRPRVQLLKSDIYDVEITGIDKGNILPHKSNEMAQLKVGDTIDFNCFYSEPKKVKISYRDFKNNLYEQTLSVTPFYNGGSVEKSKQWNVTLSNRNWLFIKSFKRKYL